MRRLSLGLAALLLVTAIGWLLGADPARAADVEIDYQNGAWSPNPAVAHVGDQVFFCNGSDQNISVTIEGAPSGDIAPDDCSDALQPEDADIGPHTYSCASGCTASGTLTVEAAVTTTTAPPPGATTTPPTSPPTTAAAGKSTSTSTKKTSATFKRTTATARKKTTSAGAAVTTSSELTTTTSGDTTTSDETTTTAGEVAIKQSKSHSNGSVYAIFGALALIALGGGYALWRSRNRFIR